MIRQYELPKVYNDGSIAIPHPVPLAGPEDAEEYAEALKAAAEEAREKRDGPFVQVKFEGGFGRLYTYRDPSGRCEIGDLVQVPAGQDNDLRLATVERFGRGSAVRKARIVKQVHSILTREVL